MKPRKVYRSRPKKNGAKKRQRILSQKRRLVDAGVDEGSLKKKTVVEIRELVKETAKKTAKAARESKKMEKAASLSKKTAKAVA